MQFLSKFVSTGNGRRHFLIVFNSLCFLVHFSIQRFRHIKPLWLASDRSLALANAFAFAIQLFSQKQKNVSLTTVCNFLHTYKLWSFGLTIRSSEIQFVSCLDVFELNSNGYIAWPWYYNFLRKIFWPNSFKTSKRFGDFIYKKKTIFVKLFWTSFSRSCCD